MDIVTSNFPTRQRLAETSFLRLGVQNVGERAVPNLAVTIEIAGNAGEDAIRPFSVRDPQPNLAAPDRPVWILENNYPRLAGEETPAGAETANTKTFAFGELPPGETVEAVWKVTPVAAGNYTLTYRIDAGLDGKAKAETQEGAVPRGRFAVRISNDPPQTRVDDQGNVVATGQNGGNAGGGQRGGNAAGGQGGGNGSNGGGNAGGDTDGGGSGA